MKKRSKSLSVHSATTTDSKLACGLLAAALLAGSVNVSYATDTTGGVISLSHKQLAKSTP